MNFTRAQGVFTSITQQESGNLVIKPTSSVTIDGIIDTLLPGNTENVLNFKEKPTANSYLSIDTLNGNKIVKFGATPKISFGNLTNASSIIDAAVTFKGGVGISKNLHVGGNLIVNGNSSTLLNGNLTVNGILTAAVFRSALHVENGFIVLGDLPETLIGLTGNVESFSGTGPWSATITGLDSTGALGSGDRIVATDGAGRLGGETCVITSVTTNSITYTATGSISPIAGGITNIALSGATDNTADGGGIVLKGLTDKTISWLKSTNRWTYNVDIESTGVQNTPIGNLVPNTGKFTNLQINNSLVVPVGDSAARPVPAHIGEFRYNTYLNSFEGYDGAIWLDVRRRLTPTSIKSAEVEAIANQVIIADSSSGSYTIKLPSSLSDGDTISVIDGSNSFGVFPVTLKASGSTIEESNSLILDVTGSHITIVYDLATTNWVLQYIPAGYIGYPSSLSSTATKTSNYIAQVNDLVMMDASGMSFNVTLPDSPSNGSVIGFMDVSGSLGMHAVTILPHSGDTIYDEFESALLLDIPGTYITLEYISGIWHVNYNPIGYVGDPSSFGLTTTAIVSTNSASSAEYLVRVDARSNSITVTLPLNPSDGDIIGIADCFGFSDVHPITVLPNTGDSLLSDTGLIINVPGAIVILIYDLDTTNWGLRYIPGNTGTNGLTPTPLTQNILASSFELLRVDTTDGILPINFPTYPLNGDMIGLVDLGNSLSVNPVRLNAGTGKTIDGSSAIDVEESGTYREYLYDDHTLNWKLITPVANNLTSTLILSGSGSINIDIDFKTLRGNTIILNLPTGVTGAVVNFTNLQYKAYVGSKYSFDIIISHIEILSDPNAIVFKYNNTSFPKWNRGVIPTSTIEENSIDNWEFFTYDGGNTLVGKQNLADIK
jgi:hypothetical protein